MTAREKFKIGDRVCLTEACIARLSRGPCYRRIGERPSGTVTGYGRDPAYVRITRDGMEREDRLGWRTDDLETLEADALKVDAP